jgi:hypothetical protein
LASIRRIACEKSRSLVTSIYGLADSLFYCFWLFGGNLEKIEDLYEEFCRTFCFRPGVNFMDYLKAEGHTDLIKWFHWTTPEPEPKAIIRLMVATTRAGQHVWDKKGLSLFHDGSWDRGGGPSDYTKDALSVLAKVLVKPIKVGYQEKQYGPIYDDRVQAVTELAGCFRKQDYFIREACVGALCPLYFVLFVSLW